MSLLDRGGPQGQLTLDPVALYVWDAERKLLDVLDRYALASEAPAQTSGMPRLTAMLRSLLCSRATFKSFKSPAFI